MNHETDPSFTHLIWDFNGTVLDDVQICVDSINRMLEARGLPIFPDCHAYRERFCFPVIEYYRSVGLDLEQEDYYTVLAPEWVAHYVETEPTCGLVPGVLPMLRYARKAGYRQILLSATQEEQLRAQVTRLGIADYFDELCGNDNIHAAGKLHLAEAWMAAHPAARPLFIGDTEHDAEVAEAIGAACILYTGGHQSEARLARMGCPLIRHMEELAGSLAKKDKGHL